MLESSVLAAFGAMVCWGIGDFLIQRSSRHIGDVESLAMIGIIGSIGLLPFVAKEIPMLFSIQNLALLFFLGVLTFVVAIINFEALKKGKLCVVEVILELELPITVVLGFLFLKETLSLLQLCLVLLILIGIVTISTCSLSCGHFKRLEKGIVLAFFAAIGMAFLNLLTGFGSRTVSPLMAIWLPWLVFSIICLAVIWKREGLASFAKNSFKFKKTVLLMGFFDTIAWLLFAFAVLEKELAITTAITESYPAIAIFLGLWLNKEKILPHQYAGTAIALIASLALGLLA